MDPTGNLVIADQGNSLIREVESTTGIITTLAGDEGKTDVNAGEGEAQRNPLPAAPESGLGEQIGR